MAARAARDNVVPCVPEVACRSICLSIAKQSDDELSRLRSHLARKLHLRTNIYMWRERERDDRRDDDRRADNRRGDNRRRDFFESHPVVVAKQRSPVHVLSKGAYKAALPTMVPEDVKDEIATAAEAGAVALLLTAAAKREVDRVLSKQYKPSDKELANGMVREAKVTGL